MPSVDGAGPPYHLIVRGEDCDSPEGGAGRSFSEGAHEELREQRFQDEEQRADLSGTGTSGLRAKDQ